MLKSIPSSQPSPQQILGEEEVLADLNPNPRIGDPKPTIYRLSIHNIETKIDPSVILTARKGRENKRIDEETGFPISCIGIPFRIGNNSQMEILLMKSSKGEWRFPGGTWESDESKQECVVRECREEGGIRCCVIKELKSSLHFSKKLQRISKRYLWFLVEIKEYFNRTAENRERQFFPFHEVFSVLSTKEMKENWSSALIELKHLYKDYFSSESNAK